MINDTFREAYLPTVILKWLYESGESIARDLPHFFVGLSIALGTSDSYLCVSSGVATHNQISARGSVHIRSRPQEPFYASQHILCILTQKQKLPYFFMRLHANYLPLLLCSFSYRSILMAPGKMRNKTLKGVEAEKKVELNLYFGVVSNFYLRSFLEVIINFLSFPHFFLFLFLVSTLESNINFCFSN